MYFTQVTQKTSMLRLCFVSLLAILILTGCGFTQDWLNGGQTRLKSTSLCDDRICLVVFAVDQDSDGDGVTDEDERVAGTDPNDASSRPPVLDLFKLIGNGALPSFNRGFSEIVALPNVAPDGSPIGNVNPLETGPTVPKRDGSATGISVEVLKKAGISVEALKKAGISVERPFVVEIALPKADGSQGERKPPPMKVGGIDMALLAQGELNGKNYCGADMDRCPEPPAKDPPDGGVPPKDPPAKDPPSGGGADGGTKTEKSWWCRNVKLGCDRTDDDPAGNNISVVEITAADLARVKAKLGSTKRPGPETPTPVEDAQPIVERDPLGPILLYDPDERSQQGILLQKPKAGSDPSWNTNFGPKIVDQIDPISGGLPRPNPGNCPPGERC